MEDDIKKLAAELAAAIHDRTCMLVKHPDCDLSDEIEWVRPKLEAAYQLGVRDTSRLQGDAQIVGGKEAPSPFTSGMSGYIRVKPPDKPKPEAPTVPHKLINPADRECSPCVADCPGCEAERGSDAKMGKCKHHFVRYKESDFAPVKQQVEAFFEGKLTHFPITRDAIMNAVTVWELSRASQGPQPVADSLSALWDGNSLPLSPGEKIAYRGIAQTVWDAAQKSQAEENARLQRELTLWKRSMCVLYEMMHRGEPCPHPPAAIGLVTSSLDQLQTELARLQIEIDSNPYRKMVLEHIATFPSGHITDRLHEVDGAEIERLTGELSRLTAEEKKRDEEIAASDAH